MGSPLHGLVYICERSVSGTRLVPVPVPVPVSLVVAVVVVVVMSVPGVSAGP